MINLVVVAILAVAALTASPHETFAQAVTPKQQTPDDKTSINEGILPAIGSIGSKYFFQRVVQVGVLTGFAKSLKFSGNKEVTGFVTLNESLIVSCAEPQGILLCNYKIPDNDSLKENDSLKLQKLAQERFDAKEEFVWVHDTEDNARQGYCLGKIIYYGRVKIMRSSAPRNSVPYADWNSFTKENSFTYPDSALCFGPVSPTSPDLDLASSDMLSLRDALLIVSGMKPTYCEPAPDEGGRPQEKCTSIRARGSQPGPKLGAMN